MFNKTIVTRLERMLLICTIVFNTCAVAAPTPAEQVPVAVEQAARQHVLRWADTSGLVEPEIEVTLLRGSRPLAACAQAVSVEALDVRLPSRMRFGAAGG